MIKHVTEKETQLANMLHTCSETLKQVTAERNNLAGELKALRDSGVELPSWTLLHRQWPDSYWYGEIYGYTEDQLRDYGNRRAAAERERAAKVCDSYVAELAALKSQKPAYLLTTDGHIMGARLDAGHAPGTLTKLYLAAGAQPAPKQEPVAWRYRVNNTHTLYSECPVPDDAYDAGTLTPLYAAPTQAQPVKPLTDDDIHERYKSVRTNDTRYIDIYRDAEAAHNIKEQP